MITGEKKEKTKNGSERGITIIALVVSVIILLILAGISVQMLMGEQGIISKAGEAAVKSEIADYEEQLELLGVDLVMDDTVTGQKQDGFIDRYKEKIEEDETFKDSDVWKRDEDSLIVETEEGYIFEVTDEGTDYLGKRGDEGLEEVPDNLTEDDIQIICVPPEEWTQKVDVTINIMNDDLNKYILQYSEDGSTWKNYDGTFTVTKNNTEIKVRLTNTIAETVEYPKTASIKNIDKLAPKVTLGEITPTTNSITINATGKDKEATDTDGMSKVNKIKFFYKTVDEENWHEKEVVAEDGKLVTHTFTELKQSTQYNVKVVAVDNAGNDSETGDLDEDGKPKHNGQETPGETSTPKVPGGNDSPSAGGEGKVITISYKPDTWTNHKVTVKITTTEEFNIQYSIDKVPKTDAEWINYSTEFTVSDNCTIYARLWDGTNGGECATSKLTIIDKLAPSVQINNVTSDTKSITINATGTDQNETETDGKSEIKEIKFSYSTDGTQWTDETVVATDGTQVSHTFDKLTQGTNYKVKVVAIDTAGNDSETGNSDGEGGHTGTGQTDATTDIETETLPDAEGSIKVQPSTDDWTNHKVTVGIEDGKEHTEGDYYIEYQIDDGEWQKYEEPFDVEDNCKIKTRYTDGTNHGQEKEDIVDNIDKLAPKVTIDDVTSTTNSVTVEATGTDQDETDKDGESGVKELEFWYREKGEEDWKGPYTESVDENGKAKHKFEGLPDGTEIEVKVVAKDNAGNDSETGDLDGTGNLVNNGSETTEHVETETVPSGNDLTGEQKNITISYTPLDTWTKSVNVTVTTIVPGYTLQYSTDNRNWTSTDKQTATWEQTSNCTVYARLWDGYNDGLAATETITKIDRLEPNDVQFSGETHTTRSITIKGSATDQDSNEVSGRSEVKEIDFYYSLASNDNWEGLQTKVVNPSGEAEVTFDELNAGTAYKIKAVARDNAGNEKTTICQSNVTTNTMPEGGDGTKGNIKISVSPATWTNQQVTVTITKQIEGFMLQYSTNNQDWNTVAENNSIVFPVKDNCTVYARLYDGKNVGSIATSLITIIDKLAPGVTINNVTSNTRSITVKATGTDQTKTEKDGSSQVKKLQFYCSKDGGVNWGSPVEKNASDGQEIENTFDNLEQGTPYKVKVVAFDTAGNDSENGNSDGLNGNTTDGKTEAEKSTKEQTTTTIPEGKNITITCNPENAWTKQVSVTVSTKVTGYTLQYTTNDSSWEDITGNLTKTWDQTTNCTVRARLSDGVNYSSEQSKVIDKIDTLKPNEVNFTNESHTTSTIKITGNVSDKEPANGSNKSGIKEIKFSYSTNGTNWIGEQIKQTEGTAEVTFSKLKAGTGYKIRAIAIDNAGNETETIHASTVTTNAMPEGGNGTTGNIKISYTPTEWTSGSVTVTITSNLKDYTIQYATGSSAPSTENAWMLYNNTFQISDNGINIYARLWDGTNGGTYATGTVKNIDKVDPKDAKISVTGQGVNTISVSASATDGDATSTSGVSGIKQFKFYYSTNGQDFTYAGVSAVTTPSTTATTTYQYTGLSVSKQYTLKVEAYDQVSKKKEATIQGETKGNAPTISISPSRDYNGTHSIKLTVTGQDLDGGTLNYTLDYGTSQSYGKTDSKTGTAGTTVTFTLSNLTEYTTYYYKVTATDDSGLKGENTGNYRTYCVGTYCSGSTERRTPCSYCDGDGTIPYTYQCPTCSGNGTITSSSQCPTCQGHGTVTSTTDCPDCDMGYKTVTEDCSVCRGSRVRWNRSVPWCSRE